MRFENFSVSLPRGYPASITEEAARYGFNRSEFMRVLFDAYLSVSVRVIQDGKRENWINPGTGRPELFPNVLPHRREEANEWLREYLRIVIRIAKSAEERKKQRGSVDTDAVDEDVI